MRENTVFPTVAFVVLASLLASPATSQTELTAPLPNVPAFDLVIENGRVLDPATERDEILNIGITDGEIVSLTTEDIDGKREIDATGYFVAPGFIDLHTHSPFRFGQLLQTKDGVTTSLDLEAGAFPVDQYGEFIAGEAYGNYGSSVGHYAARIKVI